MNKKLSDALNEVREEYIAEAAAYRRRRPYWLGAVAAVLALVILIAALGGGSAAAPPVSLLSGQIAAPVYPVMAPYPNAEDGYGYDAGVYQAWMQSQKEQYDQPEGYADSLADYFAKSIPLFLSGGDEENAACSPLNVYMALAMLAEISGGSSRAQILDLLSADSIEALRTQAGHVWNAHYCDDGATASLLASSLWLDNSVSPNQATVDTLADSYYASVFRQDLDSEDAGNALFAWLDQQTDGLLREQAQKVSFPEEAVMALATTVYYRAKWDSEFSPDRNTQGTFHTLHGDVTATFMNKQLLYNPYYYGDGYAAMYLELQDGSRMWLILPDEGETPRSVLESGSAVAAILQGRNVQSANVRINLSLPKFDIASDTDISGALQTLGITDVFRPSAADLSPILPKDPAYLSEARHAARVAIDEKGVTAAAYTVMQAPGAAPPPEDEVDFVLDRPFLFIITSRDNLPVFAGIVNNP